ncbi:MAG: hypothetical protein K2Y51_25280 [Gammaproteobacteria bacterium]|nr:hypothetical protein [Gammaproteobacteria bacterium]
MKRHCLTAALLACHALLVAGCARTPAECAVPDVVPAPPLAHAERRIVAALDAGGDACHVRLRLPDDTRAEDWAIARDAALREATLAASAACCPAAAPRNAERWPAGATTFELAFGCATAR